MTKEALAELAEKVWKKLDGNQRTAVRIGMFPAEVMRQYPDAIQKDLCVALMNVASKNGGMIA